MSIFDFLSEALEPNFPDERRGQRFMTYLWIHNPDLYVRMIESKIDCFYEDKFLFDSIKFVVNHWMQE